MSDRSAIVPLRWDGEILWVLDQLALPATTTWISCKEADQVARCIRDMNVRGAPAIGVAAAFGVVLGLKGLGNASREAFGPIKTLLAHTRPTAVNLFWALERMERTLLAALEDNSDSDSLDAILEREAQEIRREDEAFCKAIGQHGATLVPKSSRVLTHCNAGALATAAYGTALGVIRAAHAAGNIDMVYADETRPFLQGARLTTWELHEDNIPVRLVCDSMPGSLMARGLVDLVVVGADRIASNGDVANKIGTYQLAVLCKYHDLPFYVAAPTSTIDTTLLDGTAIPIEERSSDEVVSIAGTRIAPEGVTALHPAFDVTPAGLITAIITERGILRAPYADGLEQAVAKC